MKTTPLTRIIVAMFGDRTQPLHGNRLTTLKPGLLLGIALSIGYPGLVSAEAAGLSNAEAEQLFAHKLWPTITSSCLACHGEKPDKLKGGLDLRSLETARAGGDSGPAFQPEAPDQSLLIQAIEWQDEDLQMPPKKSERLTSDTVALFKQWVQAGAPWPSAARIADLVKTTPDQWSTPDGIRVATSGGLNPEWTERKYSRENLWAYRPLAKPIPPASNRHPIDAFLEARINEVPVTVAPQADRVTLLRRASYNLLGLPPTPDEVASFLSDPRPDAQAFSVRIDRLLNSPHYGEHWGRHWLDVVRYADTSGFANDFDRGNAWRYRDYVVRAFNDDKPYATFVQEQIAGDELKPKHPEGRIAVGFLRMGPWELTGMEVPAIARQRFLDDAVNAVGQSFLGHTLRCAKCHDHKFDPIPTRDYYALYTTFNSTQLAESSTPFLPVENVYGFDEKQYLSAQERRAQETLKQLNKKSQAAIADWFRARDLPYKTRAEAQSDDAPPENIPPRRHGFSVEDFGKERIARKTLIRLDWQFERYQPVAFSVYSGLSPQRSGYTSPQRIPKDPPPNGAREPGHILISGNAFSRGPKVSPAPLSVLNEWIPDLAAIPFPESLQGRRSALARWITHPANPLTYRAIVNRIWQWHFGQALAGNPNNLGASGKKPTHPELLDWLAVEFRESGGSFKAMHRLIMSSDAYRRASNHPEPNKLRELDPNGTLYARFHPRRLRSEELRDSMLQVSGELNPTIGGIPNRPEINLEVALQPRMVMGTFATAWQPNSRPSERHRRSLYALKIRGLRDPFMEVFNEPDPDLSCEARDASNVTPQVFSLFNSQIAYDRALAFALRIERESQSIDQAIQRGFQLAFNRAPSQAELTTCLQHHAEMRTRHEQITLPKPDYPREVIREAVEENTGEKFQFSEHLDVFEAFEPDTKMAEVPPVTRALAELCLILFNSNEFAYIY